MFRVVIFLVLVGVVGLGAAWLADRPGEVAVTWMGWRIETSVMVLAAGLLAVTALCFLLWSLIWWVLRSPGRMASFLHKRRVLQGYQAISSGLIAIGAGDSVAARRFSGEAKKLSGDEPLALLLAAQSAQLSGDRAEAARAFNAMAARPDTKLLGLRGLYMEAQRRADMDAARFYAEEAAREAPKLSWAGQAVLDYRSGAGDWAGALDMLERLWRGGLLDKARYQRQRAVLLTARGLALLGEDRDEARHLLMEAAKLEPTFVPAVASAARLHAEAGELRKASRMIEKAWRVNPHPDLANVYANLRFGNSARDRLARAKALAAKAPRDRQSALAVARAALEALEFATAREALEPLLADPTHQVAILMAEIEKAEHGDEGRARQWIARAVHAARDPAWTADGFVSDRWMAVSPVTGRLDAFEWKVPLSEIGAVRPPPIIDEQPVVALKEVAPVPPPQAVELEPVAELPPPARPQRRKNPRPDLTAQMAPLIPLVHAPDDPGPEAASEPEPVVEKSESDWPRRPFAR